MREVADRVALMGIEPSTPQFSSASSRPMHSTLGPITLAEEYVCRYITGYISGGFDGKFSDTCNSKL
ncbi:hypothetical protein AGR6A_pAt60053 [Agrobacterium sp. NCPPB 925]|nr:hypothetical protein AGR6A_pAt60053 [Agrobacterium sp. NCPPB 925]